MNTTQILLAAILVGVMSLVAVSVMNVLTKHMWETRSRLEKAKKSKESIDQIREEHKLVNSWKGHLSFFANAILYGSISSFVLYHIIKYLF
jgi:hypothetical protein